MTREEKIELLEFVRQGLIINARVKSDYDIVEALGTAISALKRPPREQLEKAWRGEWQMVSNGSGVCSECHRQDKIDPLAKFCRYCGTPLTDEAVDMVMERLEAIDGETD